MKRLVLEPEHEAFRETVRQFIDRRLVPNVEQWEPDRLVDRSAFAAAGKYGLIGFNMPEQYGGGGVDDFRFERGDRRGDRPLRRTGTVAEPV